MEDIFGNTNGCTRLVTVLDGVAPEIYGSELTVDLGNLGGSFDYYGDVENTFSVTVSDSCGPSELFDSSITANPPSIECAAVGSDVIVTLSGQDAAGNVGTGTTTVTVIDTSTEVTYYADVDGDNLGDINTPLVGSETCVLGVLDATDCDDSDASIGVGEVDRYPDGDGDGLGDSTSPLLSVCIGAPGYVENNDDCDDSTDSIGALVTLYPDSDGDNLGDATAGAAVCPGTPGYVSNDDDCNDDDDTIRRPISFFADLDGDGFGDPASVVSACPGAALVSTNSLDCNDGDSSVTFNTYAVDSDGDSFGHQSDTVRSCADAPGSGQVLLGGPDDCNDLSSSVFPGAPDGLPCNGRDNDCDEAVDEDDTDGDGLSDCAESQVLNTDWRSTDTDTDAFSDYEELEDFGTNPREFDSNPCAPSKTCQACLAADAGADGCAWCPGLGCVRDTDHHAELCADFGHPDGVWADSAGECDATTRTNRPSDGGVCTDLEGSFFATAGPVPASVDLDISSSVCAAYYAGDDASCCSAGVAAALTDALQR